MNTNQHTQIEAYLSGEMNADQLAKFESEVHVNPELQQELNFQSEIIQGIGKYRKTELIARLDALKVPPAWWSVVQHSPTFQYIGGVIVTTLVGTGIWFILPEDATTEQPADLQEVMIVNTPNQKIFEWNLPEITELEKLSTETSSPQNKEDGVDEDVQVTEKSVKSFIPVVAVPTSGDIEAEKDFVPEQAGEPSKISTSEDETAQPLAVEVVESSVLDVKYRYFEGKLYLYGQFRNTPYEILEINSASGRRIYLYHLDAFYEITSSDIPVNLTVIENSKLIQELEILRKTK